MRPLGMILIMGLLGLLCVALSVALVGCAEEPDQTIVTLDADEAALEGATQLRVQVCDASGGQRHDQTVFLSSFFFPEPIPINPLGGDLSRVFGLEATLLSDDDLALQSQRVLATFPGGKAEVTRRFDRACANISCPRHQTCVSGSCDTASAPWRTFSAPEAEILLACAQQEQCNGVDDDSDGAIDEGNAPAVMPTVCDVGMGLTEINNDWMDSAQDRLRLNSVTLSGCEHLGSAYMYLSGQGSTGTFQPIQVVIYSNDNDEPAELLALSREVRINGSEGPMWYEFGEWERPTGELRLDSGEYWLGSFAGAPVGDGSREAAYDGLPHEEGQRVGRLGDDDSYQNGPEETFVEDAIRTLDREITMFVACAP